MNNKYLVQQQALKAQQHVVELRRQAYMNAENYNRQSRLKAFQAALRKHVQLQNEA